jgi:hypothetical protein
MKIALVGTCPSSRMLAPYRDPEWEIWACSPDNAGALPRVTRWFEIHGDLGFADAEPWERSYIDWVNAQPFEVIAQDHRIFPRASILPKDELIARFGRLFFTSTPAWMMAFAIKLGAKQIGLYGLDMAARAEYVIQRPGMHHFIELAEQRFGIEVHAPLESDILQPAPLYGYSLSTPHGRKMEVRRKELMARIADLDQTLEGAKRQRAFLEGALDDIDYVQSIWGGERSPALEGPVAANEAVRPSGSKVVNLRED